MTNLHSKDSQNTNYNGSIHHEGFKFHRKYIGKKSCTYWCANNRSKDSPCSAKIKVNSIGTVVEVTGKHDSSCFLKQETMRVALGLVDKENTENAPIDVTHRMLERAEEIALKNLSMPPKKIHLQVLKEMECKHKMFRGASNTKVISRIKNARTKMNGNDVYRTIEMENLSKIKNSNLFFYNLMLPILASMMAS